MLHVRLACFALLAGMILSVRLSAQIPGETLSRMGTRTNVPIASLQKSARSAGLLPEGFWVTETTPEVPGRTLIHFYDAHQQLIRTDTLAGATPNLRRREVVRRLNRKLVAVLQQQSRSERLAGNKQP